MKKREIPIFPTTPDIMAPAGKSQNIKSNDHHRMFTSADVDSMGQN